MRIKWPQFRESMMCCSCFAWADKGGNPVPVAKNRKKGDGVMYNCFLRISLVQLERGKGE